MVTAFTIGCIGFIVLIAWALAVVVSPSDDERGLDDEEQLRYLRSLEK